MKVIQILPELNSGGVERGTLELGAYLVAHGHESIVISNGGRLVEKLEREGSRHIQLPVHRKSLRSLGQVRVLRRLLREEKPDILHIRSRVPGWIAWLAWRKMDPASRPRLVSTVHGFYSVNRYSAIMTYGERVIAVSESVRKAILENYPSTPKGSISMIYRGIVPEMYPAGYQPDEAWLAQWHAEHPELACKAVFLLPGRITRLKGHQDFFGLIKGLNESGRAVHGLIAGDTHEKKRDYLDELKAILKESNLHDDVTFLGHRKDIREVMAVSDVVCALSQQPESFGRTVLEAMALGRPVLGYDCGGVGELLEKMFPEGKCELGNADQLLERAKLILDETPRPHVPEGTFTLEAMCADTLTVYQNLLDAPR